MPADLLKALGLASTNSGTYLGSGEWSTTTDAGLLQSINPTTNEVIAEVHASSQADYEKVVARAQAALADYQGVPASQEALDILVNSYDKLGMNDLRDDAKRVREANFANAPDATKTTQKKGPWWKLW